jgi:hypothetical protein
MKVNSERAAAIVGLGSARTVQRWVADRFFTPRKTGIGKGGDPARRTLFTEPELMGLAVAVDLRRRGFSRANAGLVGMWLARRPLAKTQADIEAGRTLLLAVSGETPDSDRLLTLAEAHARQVERSITVGRPMAVVDVSAIVAAVMAKPLGLPSGNSATAVASIPSGRMAGGCGNGQQAADAEF